MFVIRDVCFFSPYIAGSTKSAVSSVYNTKQLTEKNVKGDLPIPETVSVYIRRWFLWVKSIYGKEEETQMGKPITYSHWA